MRHFPDTFALAPDALLIAARLVETCDEFAHLQHATIPILFSQRVLSLHGAPCAAFICLPKIQGPLRLLFEWYVAEQCRSLLDGEDPDFLLLIDVALWAGLDAERRERLIYHELTHVAVVEDEYGAPRLNKQTGHPLLKLMPHDFELFEAELVRYGVEVCEADRLAAALVEGEAQKRRRGLRIA